MVPDELGVVVEMLEDVTVTLDETVWLTVTVLDGEEDSVAVMVEKFDGDTVAVTEPEAVTDPDTESDVELDDETVADTVDEEDREYVAAFVSVEFAVGEA